ncbi:hypothetical protein AMTRI_Chr02g263010 [Amborella trichopoda]|uniref:Pentacotripeptide-repeat region of PRORP domain-containing protein n=1 Tax=Amborella trichopoda TaxID=13333 RepID=W1P6E2_AMBTC|nr:pentatricopeptide repeat-containing protein At4g38150 [Amborella trichopoda]ERN03219.1 hypothetical protein AMTR_s00003p00166290 [Amborella trichopoda]|eukprot:XP_006841544.1 pentatricopeptide repeat-containing protein At4g38150 [Amborella trichopoda]
MVTSRFLICSSSASSIGKCFLSHYRKISHLFPIVSLSVPLLPKPNSVSIPSAKFFTSIPGNIQISSNLNNPEKSTSIFSLFKRFSSESKSNSTTKLNFNNSDSDNDDEEEEAKKKNKVIDKSKLPPPYDPFSKKPVVEEPEDPKNLQEIFYKMKSEGLIPNAIKMFDALSKDGLTHEAMELFGVIKDKGQMPDIVAHTAVIEAYANAGQSKEAMKVYTRMLASGVKPNAYTYTVLIKGLSRDGKFSEANKILLEMMDKGIKPNAGTYTTFFECLCKEGKTEEAGVYLEKMKARGFAPDEKATREILSKRGHVFRSVMNLLFGK